MDSRQFQAVLDMAHSAFLSTDADGVISYWNRRAEELFGLTREQAIGRSIYDTVLPERHRDAIERELRSGAGGAMQGRRVELEARAAGGGEIPVEVSIVRTREGAGSAHHLFLMDLSARRELEREREQRLSVILDAIGEAVTIRGRDDRLLYANRAALDRIGLRSLEELRAADPRALLGPYEMRAADGSELALEDLPSVRVLRGQEAEPLTLRSVNRLTGEESWVLLKATAVRDGAGAVEAAVTIIEDITADRRSALRMEFLVRAGEILASSLDYEQTLRNVAGLAVPHIADWCGVDLFGEGGRREPVAVAHADPAKLEMAALLRAYEPETLDPDQGLGLVRRSGEPAVYNEIPDHLLVQVAVDSEHLRLLREVGMRAVLIVPLVARGATIGALTLVNAESGRTFDARDVEFAQQIAARAALAVENARLYRGRVEVARTLQNSLLPEALPQLPGWEVAALYRPAGGESDVGGDFYDLWQVGEEWMIMVGDGTGKGVAAAAVTSLVRHTAWAASDYDRRPAEVLGRVDAALKRRPSLPVCTALVMRVREGAGVIACGGHPPPLHLSEDGVGELGSYGTLLGAFANVAWPETSFQMRPGETLVAITDGVTDAVGAGDERFGAERLRALLAGSRDEAPHVIRERMLAALEAFQEGPQADDTAIVIMRYNGAGGQLGGGPVETRVAAGGSAP